MTQRVRLHRRIAEAIEEICGDDREAHLGELAHHFLEAQELDRAIDYSPAAGDRAVSLMAYEEGADLYASALQALELKAPTPGRRHIELMVALAHAQTRAGRGPPGEGQLPPGSAARARARRPRAVRRGGGGAVRLVRDRRDRPRGDRAHRGGAWRCWARATSEVRARLLARLCDRRLLRRRRAARAARRARRWRWRAGWAIPPTLAFALNDAHFVLHGPGSDVDRIELATRADRGGREGGRPRARDRGPRDAADGPARGGRDRRGATARCRSTTARPPTLRQPNYRRYALIRLAMKELLGGHFANVERLLERFSPETAQARPRAEHASGVRRRQLRAAPRPGPARRHGRSRSAASSTSTRPSRAGAPASRCSTWSSTGATEARARVRAARRGRLRDDPAPTRTGSWRMALLSEVAHYLGDVTRARVALRAPAAVRAAQHRGGRRLDLPRQRRALPRPARRTRSAATRPPTATSASPAARTRASGPTRSSRYGRFEHARAARRPRRAGRRGARQRPARPGARDRLRPRA